MTKLNISNLSWGQVYKIRCWANKKLVRQLHCPSSCPVSSTLTISYTKLCPSDPPQTTTVSCNILGHWDWLSDSQIWVEYLIAKTRKMGQTELRTSRGSQGKSLLHKETSFVNFVFYFTTLCYNSNSQHKNIS